MKTLLITLGVIAAFALVIVLFAVGSYNNLVNLQQAVDGQWAQVQNVYQRRSDLIPNLVSTVSGAANFEKSTLIAVTDARASVGRVNIDAGKAPTDAAQLAAFDQAQGQLSSALSRLLVVSEQYPQLRATENFQTLQAQLEGTENRIAVERGRYNDIVYAYDSAIRRFPAVLFANALGFTYHPYFQATAGSEAPPKVQFDFSSPAAAAQH
jgi:LemA protein